jgi:hypothetical protein
MTNVYKYNNAIIINDGKIGISENCCCGYDCNCECDPCVTISVTWGGITAIGNCTPESPGFIQGIGLIENGSVSFTASCDEGNWNIGWSACYVGDGCVSTAGGYAIWECESQSIIEQNYNEFSDPEGCFGGNVSVSVVLGNC